MTQAYQHVFKDSVIKSGKSFDVLISLEKGTHLPISLNVHLNYNVGL